MATLVDKPARSARKAKGEGHFRRSEILEAAQRIFVEQGYEGATIRRIADEVGVSSTALYMHFRDKSEILLEICEGLFENLITVNAELIARELDPVARVRMMLDAYIDFALDHPNVYRLVFCSIPSGMGPDKQDLLDGMGARTYELFRKGVVQVAKAGRLAGADVDLSAQTAWAGTHGIVSLVLTRPQFPWGEPRRICAHTLDTVFAGLFKA